MWLTFESLVNARDLGGIPTPDGPVKERRLLRSDNLQDLTAADMEQLTGLGLSDVIDLRSLYEVESEGPGPLRTRTDITFHHYSYLPEAHDGDAPEAHDEVLVHDDEQGDQSEGERAGTKLPWADKPNPVDLGNAFASHYLGYLMDRPNSVLGALRSIAYAPGAALVHCAAGKDRTGTTVALALSIIGADRDAIVADYAASSERMEKIVARLIATETYRASLEGRPLESHMTRPESMFAVMNHIDDEYGGVLPLLERIGWTDQDTDAMKTKLLG